jgi:hypothetical protein
VLDQKVCTFDHVRDVLNNLFDNEESSIMYGNVSAAPAPTIAAVQDTSTIVPVEIVISDKQPASNAPSQVKSENLVL